MLSISKKNGLIPDHLTSADEYALIKLLRRLGNEVTMKIVRKVMDSYQNTAKSSLIMEGIDKLENYDEYESCLEQAIERNSFRYGIDESILFEGMLQFLREKNML